MEYNRDFRYRLSCIWLIDFQPRNTDNSTRKGNFSQMFGNTEYLPIGWNIQSFIYYKQQLTQCGTNLNVVAKSLKHVEDIGENLCDIGLGRDCFSWPEKHK